MNKFIFNVYVTSKTPLLLLLIEIAFAYIEN